MTDTDFPAFMLKMSMQDVIAELQVRYLGASFPDQKSIEQDDIERWSTGCHLSRSEFFDQFSIAIAQAFYRYSNTYEFCDDVINDMFNVQWRTGEDWSALVWQIYEAFDAGEYIHMDVKARDPVETYTRPAITRILVKLHLITAS